MKPPGPMCLGSALVGGTSFTAPASTRAPTDTFSVVPEVGINIGYQVSRAVRLYAGYQYFNWNNVLRPGNQVGPT